MCIAVKKAYGICLYLTEMYSLITSLEKTSARTVVLSEELGIGKSGAGHLKQCARCAT